MRHRLASFSQESQRYVDLSRGGWKAIVPDAIANNPIAQVELDEFWQIAEEKYAKLRALGIRKEDARFLLPNAAETRIITTMNFAGWSHSSGCARLTWRPNGRFASHGQRALAMLYTIAPRPFSPNGMFTWKDLPNNEWLFSFASETIGIRSNLCDARGGCPI